MATGLAQCGQAGTAAMVPAAPQLGAAPLLAAEIPLWDVRSHDRIYSLAWWRESAPRAIGLRRGASCDILSRLRAHSAKAIL